MQAWQANVPEDSDAIVFSPDLTIGKSFQNPPTAVQDMIADGQGGFIIAAEDGVTAVTLDKDGQPKTSTYAFRGVDSPDGVFYRHPEGGFWLPGKGLFRVDPWSDKNYQQSFETLIRKVMTNNKQALFEGAYGENGKSVEAQATVFLLHQNKKYTPELKYVQNALSFEFAASFFEKPGTTLFQYKLEGFDKEWSNWDYVVSKEYTNIPEGKYTFRVRSKNLYGTMGQDASHAFKILPPWYRTIWAYLIWITLFCAGLVGLIQFYTFRLKREKIHLEEMVAERTQQLRDATLTDPLTGLRNRRFISEVLQSDIAAFVGYKNYLIESEINREGMTGKEVFGLFLLDMDHFKHVNDTYGHDAGDQLLKQFAHILLSSVREDDVVIRLGGEEFLVVLKKTNPDFIHDFAQKLLKKVAATDFNLGEGAIIRKTCSIGYTTFPIYHQHPDLVSFDQGVMIADMAMYHAKHQGRNQAIFLREGEKIPKTEEGVQKVVTSMEFALNGEYLVIGKAPH